MLLLARVGPTASGRATRKASERSGVYFFGVRAVLVVPIGVEGDVGLERSLKNGYEGVPQALFFEGTDEPLDHGDAAVFADRAEARTNAHPPRAASWGRRQ